MYAGEKPARSALRSVPPPGEPAISTVCTAFTPPDFPDDNDGGNGGDRDLNAFADSINVTFTDEDGCYECEVWAGSTAPFEAEIVVNGATYTADSGVLDILGTTDSVDICEPIPDLQIDVCRESGIVMVDDLAVTTSAMTSEPADQMRAWFWEPPGDPAHCADPWDAIPLDSCVVAQPDSFPDEFAAVFSERGWGLDRHTRSAGQYVELSSGRGTWRMEKTSLSGDPVYLWETLDVQGTELIETPIQVQPGDTLLASTPGSADDYFGPVTEEPWVTMPTPVSLSNVPSSGSYIESSAGLELEFTGRNNRDHLLVFVTSAPDEPGLMCRYADDGDVSLSASDLNQLSNDWASVAVYRPEIGWVTGPDGLPIRIQGVAGEIVQLDLR